MTLKSGALPFTENRTCRPAPTIDFCGFTAITMGARVTPIELLSEASKRLVAVTIVFSFQRVLNHHAGQFIHVRIAAFGTVDAK